MEYVLVVEYKGGSSRWNGLLKEDSLTPLTLIRPGGSSFMLVGPNVASTARNKEEHASRGSGGMPPQERFGFQPLLERFWWVLVVW